MDKSEVIAGLLEAKQQWDCPVAVDWAIEKIEALESENADLNARVAHLESLIADIATVAGRDTPDAIDNDGQPYQSAALAVAVERAKR